MGEHGGGLAGVRLDNLAATVVRALVRRSPELDPAQLDDVWLGNANGAGEDNRDVARMAVLLTDLPPSVPGVTVNRLCGSGLEALIGAARAVESGNATTVIAGGVESMSRSPWLLQKPSVGFPRGHETLHSTTLGWRMVNPRMSPACTPVLRPHGTVTAGNSSPLNDGAARCSSARKRPAAVPARSHSRASPAAP